MLNNNKLQSCVWSISKSVIIFYLIKLSKRRKLVTFPSKEMCMSIWVVQFTTTRNSWHKANKTNSVRIKRYSISNIRLWEPRRNIIYTLDLLYLHKPVVISIIIRPNCSTEIIIHIEIGRFGSVSTRRVLKTMKQTKFKI